MRRVERPNAASKQTPARCHVARWAGAGRRAAPVVMPGSEPGTARKVNRFSTTASATTPSMSANWSPTHFLRAVRHHTRGLQWGGRRQAVAGSGGHDMRLQLQLAEQES